MEEYEDTISNSQDEIPTTMVLVGVPWYGWVVLAVLLLGCCARAEKRYQQ